MCMCMIWKWFGYGNPTYTEKVYVSVPAAP